MLSIWKYWLGTRDFLLSPGINARFCVIVCRSGVPVHCFRDLAFGGPLLSCGQQRLQFPCAVLTQFLQGGRDCILVDLPVQFQQDTYRTVATEVRDLFNTVDPAQGAHDHGHQYSIGPEFRDIVPPGRERLADHPDQALSVQEPEHRAQHGIFGDIVARKRVFYDQCFPVHHFLVFLILKVMFSELVFSF